MSKLHPDVCARCAARGKTCCELSGGDEEFCFPLSEAERQILLAAGVSETAFVRVTNSAAFVDQLDHLIPDRGVADAFASEGFHWRLATTAAGACTFLASSGCTLNRDIRPMYCKLFPLWLFQGQLTWFTADECLANEECCSVVEMLNAMGADAAAIRKLFADMCAALGLRSGKVL